MTVGESQMAAQMSPESHKNIMHSMLKNEHIVIMASDMMDEGEAQTGNRISLCMVCQSKEEIERLFAAIGAGGKVGNSLKEEFFGTFGDLTDKFGINWMFQFGTGEQK